MSWDVFRQAAKVGQLLIAFPNSDTDKALDWWRCTLAPARTARRRCSSTPGRPGLEPVHQRAGRARRAGAAGLQRLQAAGVHREAGRRHEGMRVGEQRVSLGSRSCAAGGIGLDDATGGGPAS
jgi:hypothetical protein